MELDPETLAALRRKLRYKVIHHLGGFCPDIEDVVQDSLTRFLQALQDNRIRNPESLGAFLSGVCNNVILEYRRKVWREVPTDPADSTASVAPEAGALEMRDAIDAALDEMSDRDRQILRAFYLQERDKEEICRTLGLTDGQFRVALFRAKDRFRKIYRQGVKQAASGGH